MLSLRELRRATRVASEKLSGMCIQRIVQLDDFRLILSLYGAGTGWNLLLNCAPESAHMGVVAEVPPAPASPPAFAQYLRAHLGRALLAGAEIAGEDRQAVFTLRTREGDFRILFSIMGSRGNIYLLDHQGWLLFPMRRLEETRPELAIGQPWANPAHRLRSEGTDRWEEVPDDRYLEIIQQAYAEIERAKEFDLLARRIEQALNRETGFLERKAANLSEDLGQALKAADYRRMGELLKGVMHTVRPGDASVRATDPESGEEILLPLDPRLSPARNLEACFRRYQKEVRGADAIRRQLALLRAKEEEVERFQGKLNDAVGSGRRDLADLNALVQEPLLRRLMARHIASRSAARSKPPVERAKPAVAARLLPRRFRGEHGLEIWVGRSDEGNDYLTTRLARGNDLFFHLEGFPGSHVVLRTEGHTDPPPEAVLDACELAVHYSRLKGASSADVHVVPIKNVKKAKGAKPGLVYVTRGKTIHLRRDRRRLEGILASRLDE